MKQRKGKQDDRETERQFVASFSVFFFFYATIIEGVLLIEYLPGDANTIDLSASREGRRIISVTD